MLMPSLALSLKLMLSVLPPTSQIFSKELMAHALPDLSAVFVPSKRSRGGDRSRVFEWGMVELGMAPSHTAASRDPEHMFGDD